MLNEQEVGQSKSGTEPNWQQDIYQLKELQLKTIKITLNTTNWINDLTESRLTIPFPCQTTIQSIRNTAI